MHASNVRPFVPTSQRFLKRLAGGTQRPIAPGTSRSGLPLAIPRVRA